MATLAIEELRRLRTAHVDDPERVVDLGRTVLEQGNSHAVGDECKSKPIVLPKANFI